MMKKGYVHVYTGQGKGKTTAALGLCMRAAGQGLSCYIIQFMKGDIAYGELKFAERLLPFITIRQMGRPSFVDRNNPDPIDVQMAQDALRHAEEVVISGQYDVVVLDEVNVAVDFGLIDVKKVLDLIRKKPDAVELVLTGRDAKPDVMAVADLVTEMLKIKHYFDSGVAARDGIEH